MLRSRPVSDLPRRTVPFTGLRRAAIPAICALSALLLAGCGGGGGGGAPAPAALQLNEAGCTLQYTLTNPTILTGIDPLLASQWHLENIGQSGGLPGEDVRALVAWPLTKGLGARVAVIDNAVEVLHEDLLPNVLADASYNYRNGANRGSSYPLPCDADESHGTAVAGIIAARDGNQIGVAGVAPRATLVAYNPLATNQTADISDALRRDGTNIAAYNNSWGSGDSPTVESPGTIGGGLNPRQAFFVNTIYSGIANGRAGKGSVYVFPAGNGGCYVRDGGGVCQRDNSNFDGYVNNRGVIAVCATDQNGVLPFYGETGANVLVCAPGGDTVGITTTDIQGRYRSDFIGTSASTPVVSGVVSLILAARPDLSWRDVRLILAESARKNDPASTDWTTNYGYHYHPKYGFGVVDAQAAVVKAQTWTSVGTTTDLRSCGPYSASPGSAIPTVGMVENTITVAGCSINKIEFVEIGFAATHTYSGDMQIDLISPNALVSGLANQRLCTQAVIGSNGQPTVNGLGQLVVTSAQCGDYTSSWVFGSVRHMGEAANGAWKVRITDNVAADGGTWTSWNIRFWGRP